MSNSQTKRMELSLEGRVQGVGFRHFTVTTARKLDNVTGWVKNESDGSVTIVAEGPVDELQKLETAVQDGPRSARVDNIEKDTKDANNEFMSFEVRY
ncbi:MAG: acylphosphatase [bacterium]